MKNRELRLITISKVLKYLTGISPNIIIAILPFQKRLNEILFYSFILFHFLYINQYFHIFLENSNLSGKETPAVERLRWSLPDNAVKGEKVILRLPAGELYYRLCIYIPTWTSGWSNDSASASVAIGIP